MNYIRTVPALILTLLLATPFAAAADTETVIATAAPLVGALESLPNTSLGSFHAIHLPGYGLGISGFVTPDNSEEAAIMPAVESIKAVLQGLAGTVQGLDEGDWVSVGASIFSADVVVRVKPGDASSMEVFYNGEKQ